MAANKGRQNRLLSLFLKEVMNLPGVLGQGHESGSQQPSTRSYQTEMSIQPSQLRVLAANWQDFRSLEFSN